MFLFIQAGALHPLNIPVDTFWTFFHFLPNANSPFTSPCTVYLRAECALLPFGIFSRLSQLLFQLLHLLLPVFIPHPAPLGHFESARTSPILVVLLKSRCYMRLIRYLRSESRLYHLLLDALTIDRLPFCLELVQF
jgi:hypothetical protein